MSLAPTLDDPSYFDRLAEVESTHWWSIGMAALADAWLDSALRGRSGLRCLDVGCGTGRTLARLATRPEIGEAVGLDPSLEALGWSRRQHDRPLLLGTALALPFPAGSFDLAVCNDVFQHLPPGREPDAAAEIARVLRPGGWALVRANGRGWARPERPCGPPYRLADLVAAIGAGGLVVRRASYVNALPSLAQELRGRLPLGRRTPAHPSGGGLRIRTPRPAINRIMKMISNLEFEMIGRCGGSLPFGHSTLVLARAPGEAIG